MKTRLFVILALLAGSAPSCIVIHDCIDGNGEMSTEERDTPGFTAIANETSFEVIYRRGDITSVTVEAESNILDYIETDVRGGALEISTPRGVHCVRYTVQPVIVVTAPFIDEVVNSGSGNLIAGPLEGEEAKIIISGSGNIITGAVDCSSASLVISGSGEIKTGFIKSDEFKVTLSGSGSVETSGSTGTARYVLSGSGNLFAEDLVTDEANVTISGSGSVYATIVHTLDAVISGSGNIYLYGDPDVNINRTGSGKVIKL